jgi:hypothetical protein
VTRLERVVLNGLAVHRLTRLITHDKITESAREHALQLIYRMAGRKLAAPTPTVRAKGAPPKNDPLTLATLITCPWCMSIWIVGAVVVLERARPESWAPMRDAAATAAIAGCVAQWALSYE